MIASGTERVKEILRERAKKLAVAAEGVESGQRISAIEFLIAGESYGIELQHVCEVCRVDGLVEIPCVPDFVFGVINLHGKIVSIMDLRIFFQLPPEGLSAMSHAIVIGTEQMTLGILTDEIVGIAEIEASSLQSALPTFDDRRSDYLKGLTSNGMAILDAESILSDPSIIVDDSI